MTTPRNPASVRFESVDKRFGAHHAVRDVSLEVEAGECLVLLGPSGCGKTTLLRLVAGLEQADGGTIAIGDRVVNALPASARDVAMVFQNYALYPHLTVAQNISFPLEVQRVPDAERRERVREVAARFGLESLLDRKPGELSGGQQQRVALGRAVVRNPAVYLMDEPLSNLDAQLRTKTRAELKRLQRDLGTTTLYVTHDQSEAMTLGQRVAVMKDGRIHQLAAPMDLYRRPASTFVASFIGSPAMNLLDGTFAGSRLEAGGATWDVALPEGARGRDVTAGVRAEGIQISVAPRDRWVQARAEVVEPLGNETLVTLALPHGRVVARGPAVFDATADSPVWIHVPPEAFLFFDRSTGTLLQ